MAFIATPQGIEVKIIGFQNDVPIVNVFHVDNGATVTPTDLVEVTADVASWFVEFMIPTLHNSYFLEEIVATDISVENGAQHIETSFVDNQGNVGGDAAAANAALVVSWRTALTGRSYRGRTYIGGLPQAVLEDAQHVDVTSAATYATNAQELIDAIAAGGRVLCVLSKVLNGVARVAGVLTEIIEIIVNTKIDSQRRRTAN